MSVRNTGWCVTLLLVYGSPTAAQSVVDEQLGVPPTLESELTTPRRRPVEVLSLLARSPAPEAPTTAKLGHEAPGNQAKQEAGEQEKLAALEKSVTELSKNITVVTADPNYKLVLGGAIIADFLYNSARPVAPGTPFFLLPRPAPGFDQATFDANARQTMLSAYVSGPTICDFQSAGLVVVNLYNDAVVNDRYGLLPLQAFVELRNDDWRFAAGLQFDIFNPLNPTVLPFSFLSGSGNTGGSFRGQARVERFLHPSDDAQITLTVGVSEPIATTFSDAFRLNEDNGWPNVEGRAALALGPLVGEGLAARRPFEVGLSGLVGQIRTTVPGRMQVVADVWGLGTDARWAITDRFGVQGECHVGQSLGTYGGAILQNINPVTLEGLRSAGAWGEVYFYLCPDKLHTHLGYGIDDPVDRDLAPLLPVRNETYFANLIWEVTKNFRLAAEVTYRETAYTVVPNNDGVGFQTQVLWKF